MSVTPVAYRVPENAAQVVEKIRDCHRKSNAVRAELLREIAAFEYLDLAVAYGAASTQEWLQRELKVSRTCAYEYVSVGCKLMRFPALFEAFHAGLIDYTAVRFLLKYVTEDNELELVELGKELCFSELQQALAGNDPEDEDGPAMPFFKMHDRSDGMVEGEFLLTGVDGARLRAALKIAQLALYGLTEEDVELEEPESMEPPEVEEACPAEQVDEPRLTGKLNMETILRTNTRFGRPLQSDMYDALVSMINLAHTHPGAPKRCPGAQVNIMLTEDGRGWMPANPQVPSRVLAQYVVNATARAHLLDSAGLTMYYGRSRRLASDAQVEALLAVWGGQCAMPGCTHSRFLEMHHIREWAEGGKTDIDNLIPLCSSCHSKVSIGLATITPRGRSIEFEFVDGSRYVSENRGMPKKTSTIAWLPQDDPLEPSFA